MQYSHDQWRLKYSQAYILQDGPAELILVEEGGDEENEDDEFEDNLEGHGETKIVGSALREQRSGYGDPNLTLSYTWPEFKRSSNHQYAGQWSIAGRWKIPAADQDQGFSNGRHEYTYSLSRSQRFDQIMLHGRIGRHYRQYEDGADNTVRNQVGLGGMVILSRRSSLGASLYYKQATRSQPEAVKSMSFNVRTRLTRHWQMGATIGKGLSESAADLFAGLDLSYRWRLD